MAGVYFRRCKPNIPVNMIISQSYFTIILFNKFQSYFVLFTYSYLFFKLFIVYHSDF